MNRLRDLAALWLRSERYMRLPRTQLKTRIPRR